MANPAKIVAFILMCVSPKSEEDGDGYKGKQCRDYPSLPIEDQFHLSVEAQDSVTRKCGFP
jgi:hypothetical protein